MNKKQKAVISELKIITTSLESSINEIEAKCLHKGKLNFNALRYYFDIRHTEYLEMKDRLDFYNEILEAFDTNPKTKKTEVDLGKIKKNALKEWAGNLKKGFNKESNGQLDARRKDDIDKTLEKFDEVIGE